MWKVDLHAHTIYSKDCLTPVAQLIARARQVGLDKIAVTDHDELRGALVAKQMAPDLIIVGEEIKTMHGEIIAYFVKERVPKGLSPQETVRRLREQGAVISVPHPLDTLRRSAMGRKHVLEIIHEVDALEVLNARCVRGADNHAAHEMAHAHSKLLTAGSDAHTLSEVGRCFLTMPPFEDDAESFRDALEVAQPHGETGPFWPHLASSYAKWRKRFFPVHLP
jgi:hypothetical protein